MAKPPCARLTKPIRPIVTERPTETMNSTMPAARPPSRMPATSSPKITGSPAFPNKTAARHAGRRLPHTIIEAWLFPARTNLVCLASILHGVDLADVLLDDAAILEGGLRQVF